MCAGSAIEFEAWVKEQIGPALAEHGDIARRAREAGRDVYEAFLWLVGMGLMLDRNTKAREFTYGEDKVIASTLREILMAEIFKVRDKRGKVRRLLLNRAQQDYARRCTKRNIVLKARQLGITTYVAARFFVHTITHPGTLSVQVAHDQQSAEEIFRIVHRFVENLPAPLRKSVLRTSKANVRQIVFPYLEGLFGAKSGGDKKNAALSFVQSAISMADAVAAKQIVDQNKFSDGMGKVIDGVVACLNASIWAKKAN
jgi:hypothetical protein